MVTVEELRDLAEKERIAGNREKFLDIQKQIGIQEEERVMAAHLNYLESVKKEFPVGAYIPELHAKVTEIKDGCGTQRGWINIYLGSKDKYYTPQELHKRIREAKESAEATVYFGKLKKNDRKEYLYIGDNSSETIDRLIRTMELDLPTMEEVDDCNVDYCCEVMSNAENQAIKDGFTDEEAEEKGHEAEEEVMEDNYKEYQRATMRTLNYLLNFHDIELIEKKKGYYLTVKSWKVAAEKVVETINGVGYFYYESVKAFKEVGPYKSYCEAVIQHLHWIKDYPRVYGHTGYRNIYDR